MTVITFPRWCQLVDGKYVDIDNAHGGQCWDTFADLCISVWGIPPINTWGGTWAGWAYAIWDQYHVNGASLYFDRIPASEPALPADVAIWTDRHWYYPASHIAPVLADAGGELYCMSQNSSPPRPWQQGYHPEASGPNIRQKLTKQGLAGYLRRKSIQPAAPAPAPPKPKEWDEMADRETLKAAYREVLQEPEVLDRIALAILHRPCYLVDPTGKSFAVVGTTTLAKKINHMAHNDAQHLTMGAEIKALVSPATAVPEPAPAPELDAPAPAALTADDGAPAVDHG